MRHGLWQRRARAYFCIFESFLYQPYHLPRFLIAPLPFNRMNQSIMWSPPEPDATNLSAFIKEINRRHGHNFCDYTEIYAWSINEPSQFWSAIWDYCNVIGDKGLRLDNACKGHMLEWQFLPDAQLNFAENLLNSLPPEALVFCGEDKVKTRLNRDALTQRVSQWAQALSDIGISEGDRVAAYMPNMPETIIAMLAATSLGAVWSSCSPEFGEKAVVERFGQIKPKVLIACDGYFYNGKPIDNLDSLANSADALPTLNKVVVVPYMRDVLAEQIELSAIPKAVLANDFIEVFVPQEITFKRLPFAHPLYILFSSGTTGVPKCIVHSAGGTLLQHLKEHQLQCDIKPNDRVFYFTTCTWMMWNWLVSAMASGATLLLYDGSPFYPDGNHLWDYFDGENGSFFGTSAKYLETMAKQQVHPMNTHRLNSLRVVTSTGSPLLPKSYDFVYTHIKKDVNLGSISGGTDIISCFVLANPLAPVRRGEIACRGLGMAVEVWDESGKHVVDKKGELVCVKPFVSMPIYFLNDKNKKRYHGAYFEKYPNVWAQGDFAKMTNHGGMVIYGRSDATLNPGGVRIGTAEIYRQLEGFEDIQSSVVIGQSWQNDVRIILFVVLSPGKNLGDELELAIRKKIRSGASPRHVPAKIVQIADVPVTKSGKIAELLVKKVVEGEVVANRNALANPDALNLFVNLAELEN